MLALYDAAGLRLPITFAGLTLNDPADDADDTIEVSSWSSRTLVEFVSDGRQDKDGLEAHAPRKQGRVLVLNGMLHAPTGHPEQLFDRIKLFGKTFDPVLVRRANPTVEGFVALDFSVPTADTSTYPSGLVPSRYYARPRGALDIDYDPARYGQSAPFRLEMLLADERRYLQTASAHTQDSVSKTLANPNADYPSWPTVTITASGAGNAAWTIDKAADGIAALTLNLSGLIASDVVVVDMQLKKITKNGISTPSLKTAGGWFDLDVGNQTIDVLNLTNLAVSIAWRPAFSV
jgi:hypothetical protein